MPQRPLFLPASRACLPVSLPSARIPFLRMVRVNSVSMTPGAYVGQDPVFRDFRRQGGRHPSSANLPAEYAPRCAMLILPHMELIFTIRPSPYAS